ncbi:hypothetical protein FF096_25785 [Micromonospora sp. CP22]|nr:hypothetical protein [Micromonospora sp. CP22]
MITDAASPAPCASTEAKLVSKSLVSSPSADYAIALASEALYSYEGAREIKTMIVGWAVAGLSAFV